MSFRFGSLFTGGGGYDIGAIAAGGVPMWGIEWDADIAAVANRNLGGHVMVADVRNLDPSTLTGVDLLHASPPCPNFSVAKINREETVDDVEMGEAVARFVRLIRPRWVTIENVWGYQQSKSWRIIEDGLHAAGYWVDVQHINAADFGVPQTRKRMIVRAVLKGWVPALAPTHVGRWVGWYAAVADLVDGLPDAALASWQAKRLDMEKLTTMLVPGGGQGRGVMMSTNVAEWGEEMKPGDIPAFTTTAGSLSRTRIIVAGDQLAHTVTSTNSTAGGHRIVVGGGEMRVKRVDARCLARFQTFPDWYALPEKKTLVGRIIGNAVPSLLAQRVVESLVLS